MAGVEVKSTKEEKKRDWFLLDSKRVMFTDTYEIQPIDLIPSDCIFSFHHKEVVRGSGNNLYFDSLQFDPKNQVFSKETKTLDVGRDIGDCILNAIYSCGVVWFTLRDEEEDDCGTLNKWDPDTGEVKTYPDIKCTGVFSFDDSTYIVFSEDDPDLPERSIIYRYSIFDDSFLEVFDESISKEFNSTLIGSYLFSIEWDYKKDDPSPLKKTWTTIFDLSEMKPIDNVEIALPSASDGKDHIEDLVEYDGKIFCVIKCKNHIEVFLASSLNIFTCSWLRIDKQGK